LELELQGVQEQSCVGGEWSSLEKEVLGLGPNSRTTLLVLDLPFGTFYLNMDIDVERLVVFGLSSLVCIVEICTRIVLVAIPITVVCSQRSMQLFSI
jgi:hypothetical protein